MSLLSEFNEIISKEKQVTGQIAVALQSDLVAITPVDTGFLKNSWTPIEETKDGYKFSNTALYADIALSERRVVRGKIYGSLQNEAGIEPTIMKYNKKLQQELNRIK